MRIKGWKHVFNFTFFQTLKSKSFRNSTIITSILLILVCVGINIIPNFAGGIGDFFGGSAQKINVKTVYLVDESGYINSDTFADLKELNVEFVNTPKSELEATITKVNASTEACVLLYVTKVENNIYASISRPKSEIVINGGDCDKIKGIISNDLDNARLQKLGVSKEALGEAKGKTQVDVAVAGEAPQNIFETIIKTVVPLVSSMLLFILIVAYSQMVAQSIALEKTSRVMELLLTSIRPLAIVVGKILAMGLIAFVQLIIIGIVSALSFFISMPFGFIPTLQQNALAGNPQATAMIDSVGKTLGNINPLSIVALVVLFLLGFLFFALIAGLFGASVSRSEDLAQAIQPMALISVLGFYLAYFPAIFAMESSSKNMLQTVSYYLPISSPFALPGAVMTGEMGIMGTLIAILVLVVCVILMAFLVARVYENVVLYTGDRLKFSALLKIAKKH